jgi:hypothetical protein
MNYARLHLIIFRNFATQKNNINYEDSSYDFIGSFVYGNNIN